MDMSRTAEPYLLSFARNTEYGEDMRLNRYAGDVFSQGGEDGIIEHIFSALKPDEKFCIEFGAADGKLYSNTFNLVKNHGWNGLMIEGDDQRYAALIATAAEAGDRLKIAHGYVGVGTYPSLESYMVDCPETVDLLSIDVDGMDYHIWEAMEKPRPRVVIIEYNPAVPPDILFCQAKNERVHEGASAAALVELGRKKGYSLVAVTWCNLFFVEDGEVSKIGLEDNRLETLWRFPPRGRIFHGYNGKIYTLGMKKLFWQPDVQIQPDSLQILDELRW